MFYVYYLQSISSPDQFYAGFTSDLKQRLAQHNDGKSLHTSKFTPWKMIGFLAFDQEAKAQQFELYLKTHAGRIFLKRYFRDHKAQSF